METIALVSIYKHTAPGVFMYSILRKDQPEYCSLIITSLWLSSGFNKMLLPSHWPSWGLQSDVTLIDIGLQAVEVPIK